MQILAATGKVLRSFQFLLNYWLNSARYFVWKLQHRMHFQQAEASHYLMLLRTAGFKIGEPILTTTPNTAKLREAEHHQQPLSFFCQVFPFLLLLLLWRRATDKWWHSASPYPWLHFNAAHTAWGADDKIVKSGFWIPFHLSLLTAKHGGQWKPMHTSFTVNQMSRTEFMLS